MTTKRVLDADGIMTTVHHYDDQERTVHVERIQDVEPVLELNKALQTHDGVRSPLEAGEGSFRKVASIPLVVVEQWMKRGIDPFKREHWPKVRALLNDPENRFLKTTDKVI